MRDVRAIGTVQVDTVPTRGKVYSGSHTVDTFVVEIEVGPHDIPFGRVTCPRVQTGRAFVVGVTIQDAHTLRKGDSGIPTRTAVEVVDTREGWKLGVGPVDVVHPVKLCNGEREKGRSHQCTHEESSSLTCLPEHLGMNNGRSRRRLGRMLRRMQIPPGYDESGRRNR
jgi:hypothetical protein